MAGEPEVADVLRVMPEMGQVPGDRRTEHLVDEEPHEARKRSRSRAARSARSAAASLRWIDRLDLVGVGRGERHCGAHQLLGDTELLRGRGDSCVAALACAVAR